VGVSRRQAGRGRGALRQPRLGDHRTRGVDTLPGGRGMRRAGFYREMQIAGDEHPSLREAIGTLSEDAEKDRIVRYLADGRGVVMAPAMVGDALDPDRPAVAELGLLTDGEWL